MKPCFPSQLVVITLASSLTLFSHADEVIKANNNESLITASSWAEGNAPDFSKIAVFDATYAQAGALATGGALSWGGIKVTTFTSGANPVNIDNTTTTSHVGIGAGGIDMSAAARNLRIFSAQVQTGQSWNIASGRMLEIGVDRNGVLAGAHKVTLAGAGTLRLIGGTVSLATNAASSIGLLETYSGTLNVTHDLSVAGKFSIGETGTAVFNHSAGTVSANAATSGFGAGLNIGHRIGGNGTYNLSGGSLNTSAATTIGVGGGNTGILNISGGTANLAGLVIKTSDSASATINLTSGRLNLAAGGITSPVVDATNRNINLGGGTLGATANWTGNLPVTFTGIGGDTTINTLDAADQSTPRTITLTGSSLGVGGFTKSGAGKLVIAGAFAHRGDTQVTAGTLELDTNGRLRLFPTTNAVSNRIIGAGEILLRGFLELDLTQAEVEDGNSWLLVDAPAASYDDSPPGFIVQSTTGVFTANGDGSHIYQDNDGNTWTFNQADGRLTVEPAAALIWNNATGNGLWDEVSANWSDGGNSVAFTEATRIRFADTGNPLETIDVVGEVKPATTTFSTLTTDYEFVGGGSIGGASSMMVENGSRVAFGNTGGLSFAGALEIEGGSSVFLANAATHGSTRIAAGSNLELLSGATVSGPVQNNGLLVNDASDGTQTISGVISGSGAIQHFGAGTFILSAVNTQTGPVLIDSGVFRLSPGAKIYQTGAFFGVQNQNYITVNTDGTFESWNWNFGDANALSRLRHNYGQILLNGGSIRFTASFSSQRAFTVGANGGTLIVPAGVVYTKPAGTLVDENIIRFTSNSTLTIDGGGDAIIGDKLGAYGATGFSIAKSGTGTLTLSGTNTYTGATTVRGGTLVINGSSLADASSLVIDGGVVACTGSEVVDTLFFGSIQQVAGTWGSTLSTATHKDDTRFSGTGVVVVTTGAGGQYSTWAATHAGGGSPDDDHDGDGVRNGVEYFMNATGSTFTANPGVVAGKVTWSNGGNIPASAYGSQFVIQISTDLTTWTNVPSSDPDLLNASGSVSYTVPTGAAKYFVRLRVDPN